MNRPLHNRLAVVLYAGNHAEWEPVLHDCFTNFGRALNRLYIVGSEIHPVPESLLAFAQNAFEEVFQIRTAFDGPRGFGQRSVYEVAAKIMENAAVAHQGPLLWLGRPIEVHRSTWLDEVEQEYVAARTMSQALFMSSLFVIPGQQTGVPISAFITPHDWAASPHAGNLRKLPNIKPLAEEAINYALRDELTRPSVFRPTSLFGAADLGTNPVWAFAVRKVDQPIGPKRLTDSKGGITYDYESLIQWLGTSGMRGVDTTIFARTVNAGVRAGVLRVAWAPAYSNELNAVSAANEVRRNVPVVPEVAGEWRTATEAKSVMAGIDLAHGKDEAVVSIFPPSFLAAPTQPEAEQPEPKVEPPPMPTAEAPEMEVLADGATVVTQPSVAGSPGLALLPPRPPRADNLPPTERVMTIGVPGVPVAPGSPAPMKLTRPVKAEKPSAAKQTGKRQVVTV